LLEVIRKGKAAGSSPEILNIGCGPAQEIQDLLRTNEEVEACQFCLLDFNGETLENTRHKLDQLSAEYRRRLRASYMHHSVHDLLKRATRGQLEPVERRYDMVYCAGLFDYLSDRVCARLLNLFYQSTKPGGRVLVTNVHPSNPNRYAMEHILEWHLLYRNADDMSALCPQLGTQKIFYDDTGINVFLEITKPGAENAQP
jgi:extracellular factor (EF) 3-hydroxypalmitic acid methyl ester biosynthesis protein